MKLLAKANNRILLSLLAVLLAPVAVRADTVDKLADLEGYYVLKVKTIEGWVDKDSKTKNTGFEGCDWDRKIIFDDGTFVTCSSYSYHYAYRPKAALFAKPMSHNGTSFYSIKMLVDSDVYDMGVELGK